MAKGDFLAPKSVANRQKSIGLQKLRWYCQMCQKQCRDENGFKCHTTSESHLRQMRVFSENSHKILDAFSSEFERGFLEILSHRHGSKRVAANKVYQEYIGDKNHIHMNATIWTTLTGLCMYLGKEGKAVVDETEKGWFVQYIDRDPKVLARQAEREQRQKHDLDEEEQNNRMIEAQIAAAERKRREKLGLNPDDSDVEDDNAGSELVRDEATTDGGKIVVALNVNNKSVANTGAFNAAFTVASGVNANAAGKKRAFQCDDGDDDEDEDDKNGGHIGPLKRATPSFIPPTATATGHTNLFGKQYSAPAVTQQPVAAATRTSTVKHNQSNSHNNSSVKNDYLAAKYGGVPSVPSASSTTMSSTAAATAAATDNSRLSKSTDDSRMVKSDVHSNAGNGNKAGSGSGKDSDHKDYWLSEGLVVKIVSKRLQNGELYKQKAVVIRVVERYLADVVVLPAGFDYSSDERGAVRFDARDRSLLPSSSAPAVVRVDQDDLETVVPKESDLLVAGDKMKPLVRVTNGKGRRLTAELTRLHSADFRADLFVIDKKAPDSLYKKELRGVDFSDICCFVDLR